MARKKLTKALEDLQEERRQIAEIDERITRDDILSEDEKEVIRAKAREHVAEQRRKQAEADFLDQAIREEETRYNPKEQIEPVLLNLPEHAAFIKLDNRMFFHGVLYHVPYSVARVFDETMARMWEHQNEIDGKKRRGDLNRAQQDIRLTPGMENMRAADIVNTSRMGRA